MLIVQQNVSNFARFFRTTCKNRGVAQLVAFLVWDQDVAGSSPVTSTSLNTPKKGRWLTVSQRSLRCSEQASGGL